MTTGAQKKKDGDMPRFIVRADGRVERLCVHGVGHCVGTLASVPWQAWMAVHGCCGCCAAWREAAPCAALVAALRPFADIEECGCGFLIPDESHETPCAEYLRVLAARAALSAI